MTDTPTLQPGNFTSLPPAGADLGNVYFIGPCGYRVCRASSDITAPANKVVVTAVNVGDGKPNWYVATTTTVSSPLAAGIIPAAYGTVTIPLGANFLVQVSGPANGISAAAIAINSLVGTSATAGKIDDATIITGNGSIGIVTVAAAAADETPAVWLKGLL